MTDPIQQAIKILRATHNRNRISLAMRNELARTIAFLECYRARRETA